MQRMDAIERAQQLLAKRDQKEPTDIGQTRYKLTFNTPLELGQLDWDGFETPRHIKLIEEHLLKVESGDIKKLGIYMPPRHGKSETVSIYFLAYYIIKNPDKRIIFVTYGHEFAAEFGLRVRDIVNEYGGDIQVRPDMRQKNKIFIKGHRGSCTFTGIGGSITGKGADLLIIDDPVKGASEAMSTSYREQAKHWYRTVANTRLEPGASQIIIQTRWHTDDLSGWLQEEQPGQWTILSLPAIAGADDQMGREEGEALWPERYTIDELQRLKQEAGSFWFSAMYQQNPQPEEGGLFKREWIHQEHIRSDMFNGHGVMAMDLAISQDKSADFSAIVTVVPLIDNRMYIRSIRYGRWGNKGNKANFVSEYGMMGPDAAYVEANAFQRVFKEDIIDEYGIPLMGLETRGNKEAKIINNLQPLFEAGKIVINPSIDLDDEFMDEYLSFPHSKHDDLLDALAMAVEKCKMSCNPYTNGGTYYEFSPGHENNNNRESKRQELMKKQRALNPYSSTRSG